MKKKKRNLAPYWLILPSLVYLALFFAYPMVQALGLSIWDNEAVLPLRAEANLESAEAGRIRQGTQIEILGQQGNLLTDTLGDETNLLTELWFNVTGEDADGNAISGWVPETRLRVREEAEDGTPLMGTVRRRLGSNADPLTTIYAEPSENAAEVGKVEASTEMQIAETATLEVWYQISGDVDGQTLEGWAPSRFIQVFGDEVSGRVDRGTTGEFTLGFFEKMWNDRFFGPAVRTTLLLMVIIIPTQFILAIVMALVIQARLKFNSFFLYIFAIPLGVSDLAVGILFFAIFTQNGLFNSVLQGLGLIDAARPYLTADTRGWIIAAIWLAEVWRATSIVMIIVVSGLQAISDEVLEAAELFGAGLWQRLRHVILPLLKPSLQVALILRTILALQVFAVVIALSGGDVVTVLANETYRQYFEFRNANVASAYALFILAISMISAVFYLRAVRTQQEIAA
ncbi:ABC transporter permease subunit [Candidatus Leptofilum sp.]|uniref:ABC transporter permease subunit n=1 Tax=Candidatus Leptofilum sp. TaxID=3241576 RepID=UPI003B5B142C